MEHKQAIQVITEAVNKGLVNGIFNLIEAENVINALKHVQNLDDVKFGQIKKVELND
jgi:hypothetical protein